MIAGVSTASAISPGSTELKELLPNLPAPNAKAEPVGGAEFGDLLRGSIGKVNELEQQAQKAVEGLMRGNGVDIHQALIAAEKANAAFELTLSMRNKAIQSYQTIMSMQF